MKRFLLDRFVLLTWILGLSFGASGLANAEQTVWRISDPVNGSTGQSANPADACGAINGNFSGQVRTAQAWHAGPDDFECYYKPPAGQWLVARAYCIREIDGATPTTRGACRPAPTCDMVGNPTLMSSGEKVQYIEDWVSPRDSRFKIARHYRSSFDTTREFGISWRSNWSMRVDASGTGNISTVRVHRNNDVWHEFRDRDGRFVGSSGNLDNSGDWAAVLSNTKIELEQNGAEFSVRRPNGAIEYYQFDVDSENEPRNILKDNKIKRIAWPDGYEINFYYNEYHNLERMQDNKGQTADYIRQWPWSNTDQDDNETINKNIPQDIRLIDIYQSTNELATDSASYQIRYTYGQPGGLGSDYVYNLVLLKAEVFDQQTNAILSEIIEEYDYYEDGGGYFLREISNGNGEVVGKYGYNSPPLGYGTTAHAVDHSGHPNGVNRNVFIYDPAQLKTTVTNSKGKETVYHFELLDGPGPGDKAPGRYISRVEGEPTEHCLATALSYDYTPPEPDMPDLYIYERVERNGSITKFKRDGRGLVTKEIQDFGGPDERIILREWHPDFRLPTVVTTTDGAETAERLREEYTYDADGLLTRYVQEDRLATSPSQGARRTWTFGYFTKQNGLKILSNINGPGFSALGVDDITRFTYFPDGGLRKTTTAEGLVTEVLTRNPSGQPTRVLGQNGVVTAYTYDFRNRMTSVTEDADGGAFTTSFTYDAIGQITSMTLPKGGVWAYEYDAAQRLTKVTDPNGDVMAYTHDTLNNVTRTEYRTAAGVVTYAQDNTYDELGRALSTIGALGQTWNYRHDVEDNLHTITDPLGEVVTNTYDNLNRLKTVTDQRDAVTQMSYDEADGMESYTDPRGLETAMEYNGFGEVVREVSPDRGVINYVYDSRGLVTSMIDGRGTRETYTYDNDGRRTRTEYIDNDPLTDEISETQDFFFDLTNQPLRQGRLGRLRDESGQTTRNFDTRGNIVSELREIGADNYVISYRYDANGMMDFIRYPSGREILIEGNQADEVIKLRQRPASNVPFEAMSNGAFTYTPFGGLTKIDRENGIVFEQVFDRSYRVTAQRDLINGSVSLRDDSLFYTARDNLRLVRGNPLATNEPVSFEDQAFFYDERGMLREALGPWLAGQPRNRLNWFYDDVGNRTRELFREGTSGPGAVIKDENYSYATDSNRLVSIGGINALDRLYSYDNAGRTVGEARQSTINDQYDYGYNAAGRLAWVELNGVRQAEYLYNALGQQVLRKTWPGGVETTTLSVHDIMGNRIAEYDQAADGTTTLLREYIWLDNHPFAVVENGETFFLHWDHIDRPVMATDESGSVVWQATYTPFGGIAEVNVDTAALSTQELRFPGQWFQAETGLHQNWHRDYDPTTGRYLQPDPLGLIDGPSVYGYALQSPMRYTDPAGKNVMVRNILTRIAKSKRFRRLAKDIVKRGWVCVGKKRGTECPKDCPNFQVGWGLTRGLAHAHARVRGPAHCRKYYGHFECRRTKDWLQRLHIKL